MLPAMEKREQGLEYRQAGDYDHTYGIIL